MIQIHLADITIRNYISTTLRENNSLISELKLN